jgi:hypothetical protein
MADEGGGRIGASEGGDEAVRRRPLGVVLLCAFQVLVAVMSGTALLGLREALPGSGNAALLEHFGNIATVIGIVAMGGFVLAIGMWLLKRWAWYLTMAWTGLALAYQILLFFSGHPNYLYMAIYVMAAFYLNQREVKRTFETRREAVPVVQLEEDRPASA